MGADYVYTYVDVGSNIAGFVENIKEFICDADHDVIDKLMYMIYYDEVSDHPKTILLNLIEAFEEMCSSAKDIALIYARDSIVVFSGGYSWGDAPTDSFDIIMPIADIAREMSKK